MSEREIFIAALQQADPAERAAYLESTRTGNPALRQRLDLLLQAHDQAGAFLERPAVEQVRPQPAARRDDTRAIGPGCALPDATPADLLREVGEETQAEPFD